MAPVPTLLVPRVGPRVFIRTEATVRRLTKKLRLHPHPSFNLTSTSPKGSHIIYNPPSATPTPYVTPSLFLPASDARRKLSPPILPAETTPASTKAAAAEPKSVVEKPLPPPLSQPYEKTYHLTPEDFDEIRRLRVEDPVKWSANALARKFNVSPLVIGIAAPAGAERWSAKEKELEKAKSRWGKKRTLAREMRSRRKEDWFKGE